MFELHATQELFTQNLHACYPPGGPCPDTAVCHPKFRYLMVSGNISKTHNWERDTETGRYLDRPGPISIRVISSGFDGFCAITNRPHCTLYVCIRSRDSPRYRATVRCTVSEQASGSIRTRTWAVLEIVDQSRAIVPLAESLQAYASLQRAWVEWVSSMVMLPTRQSKEILCFKDWWNSRTRNILRVHVS